MKSRPWIVVAGMGLAAAFTFSFFAPERVRADSPLIGQVLDSDGKPRSGARVFVYTASVRNGTSSLCPSCYPDCGKSAMADRAGRFSIPALNDSLVFRVLVVARGWEPVFFERVGTITSPVEFRLARRRPAKLDPYRSMRGRVLDPLGRPVVGATLEPIGYRKNTGKDSYTMVFGAVPGTDPLCISDEQGRFAVALGDSGALWYVRVRARDLAPMQLREQASSTRGITVRMGYGAMVSGRLLREGQGLPGVNVGLVQANRDARFAAYGHEEIATDSRGVFTFFNVTAGEDYFVHGKMESLLDFGALDTTRVHAESDSSSVWIGDLVLEPGRRVAGRVLLSNGSPIPAATRILLSLEPAWDTQTRLLDETGSFDLRGIPPGNVRLNVRVPGFRLARRSSGYTEGRGIAECQVAVQDDVQGLMLILEPD